MVHFGKKVLNRILALEASPQKLARAVALGFYIAFSPFLGVQTILIFILSWIFRVKVKVVFTIVYLVNNPWSMIPIAALDYIFGQWLVEKVLGLDLLRYNPSWMEWVNKKIGYYLVSYLGIEELCFWCFMIGGNLIALMVGFIAYPCARRFFAHVHHRRKK